MDCPRLAIEYKPVRRRTAPGWPSSTSRCVAGRHRYRACLDTGTEPRFETYAGTDPAGLVWSENGTRRNLSTSQRALVAASFLEYEKEQARKRLGTSTGGNNPRPCRKNDEAGEESGRATAKAGAKFGARMGVSSRIVGTAAQVAPPRLCPLCNLPAQPARAWAASITGVAGVVGVCGRCAAALNTQATAHAKKRLSAACGKALSRPDRYWAEVFENSDQARVACGLLGTDMRAEAIAMLGWDTG